jgi:transcriptional regulator with GAF, ATPase, and Fis domain
MLLSREEMSIHLLFHADEPRSIHFSGPLRDRRFIPVDCGLLVPTLIESELFGHVKGAFTGALQSKQGLLTLAEGGTGRSASA